MWADDASVELLGYVSRELHDKPILFIIAFREAELDTKSPLARYMLQELHEKRLREIRLKPVSDTTVKRIVEHIIGKAESSASIIRLIYEKTGGNPFFVEELSRSISEQLQVLENTGRETSDIEMPATVRALIQQRLLGLKTDTLETLKLAAVIGREFTFDLLKDMTDASDDALIERLEEALRARIIREHKTLMEAAEGFTFLHPLVHEYLLQEISLVRRRKYHMRIAILMEKKYPVLRSSQPDKLAFHYLHASDHQKALKYALLAAEGAETVYAHEDARKLYEQALELIENDAILAGRVNERLGDLLSLSGQLVNARTLYETALKHVPPTDRIWRSRLHREIGHTLTREHRYEEASHACDVAENILGPELDSDPSGWRREWVNIQLDRLVVCYWQGRVDEMSQLVEKVRPSVERYGMSLQRGQFFQSLVSFSLRRDRYVGSSETTSYAEAALSASEESGIQREISWSRFWLGFAKLWHQDFRGAEEQLLKSLDEAERSGDLGIQARCLNYLTLLCRKQGRIEETRMYVLRTLDSASAARMPEYVAMAKANLSWIAWRERNIQSAENEARAALELLKRVPQGEIFAWTAVWPIIGVMITQDRTAEAVEYARLMFGPKQQPLPDSLVSILQEALDAWENGQTKITSALLTRSLEIGLDIGYT